MGRTVQKSGLGLCNLDGHPLDLRSLGRRVFAAAEPDGKRIFKDFGRIVPQQMFGAPHSNSQGSLTRSAFFHLSAWTLSLWGYLNNNGRDGN